MMTDIEKDPVGWCFEREMLWMAQRNKIIIKFPEKVVKQVVEEYRKEMLVNIENMLKKAFEEYALQSQKGVPFKERLASPLGQKIERCFKEKERLAKPIQIRPLEDWLVMGDYEQMQRLGFKQFIRYHIELAYE